MSFGVGNLAVNLLLAEETELELAVQALLLILRIGHGALRHKDNMLVSAKVNMPYQTLMQHTHGNIPFSLVYWANPVSSSPSTKELHGLVLDANGWSLFDRKLYSLPCLVLKYA